MNSEGLCRIIRECGKQGVRSFSFGSINIQFGEPEITSPVDQISKENLEQPKLPLDLEVERELRDLREMQLVLDDPLAFEESQISEDFDVRGNDRHNRTEPPL